MHHAGIGTNGSGITLSPRFRRGPVFHAVLRALGIKRADLPNADAIYLERLVQAVRESKSVDAVVGLALDGRYRDGELDRRRSPMVVPNEWSYRASVNHPELLFGASINPLRADALDELDKVAAQGAVLIKWLPNTMGFAPDDPTCLPFFRKLAEYRMPLLSHCGAEFALPGGDRKLGDPLKLRPALEEGVTIIAAHCATLAGRWVPGHGLVSGPEMLARMMEDFPGLHADLSALTTLLRGFSLKSVLSDNRLRDRLVDATDYPVPCAPWTQLGRLPWRQIREASRITNPFDRDRTLKRHAGLTDEMTVRAAGLLPRPTS
ncbi:MAG: amidohydrolase family protein [Acidobacteriota bacterium]